MIKTVFQKIKTFLTNFKQRQRVLFVSFKEEGVLLEKVVFLSEDFDLQCFRKKILIKDLNEKNFKNNLFFKFFLFFLFFPFPYKVVVNLYHLYCYSQCSLLETKRKNPSQPLTSEEINSFFLQNIWKLIEEQKRKIVKKKEIEEAEILLVDNLVCGIKIDAKTIPQDLKNLSDFQGRDFKVNLFQTFVKRSFFIDLTRVLPRRAQLAGFFEEGITLATSLYLKEFFESPKKENQPFLLFFLREKETSVFLFDKKEIYSFDHLNFGYFYLYQVFNNLLGINREVFEEIMKRLERNELSVKVRDYFLKIIRKELKNFYYAVFSLKKSLGVKKHYFYAEKLTNFLNKWEKKYFSSLVKEEALFFSFKKDSCLKEEDLVFQSLLSFSLENVFRKSLANSLVVKLIRWLIPHNIQIE
ncbi:MAG: hypothetical protein KatS3mg098_349 [Candidatus Parcubacteria bacterium]|nr:MAG: hypothetical protein KatS3mg098_349 [Candidatus Parcubacteria bacterium]